MYVGKLVFAQVMEFAPWHTFRRLVAKYRGDFNVRTFSCLDQFLSMAFAQITFRESLRDIKACFEAHAAKAYHLGLRGNFTRSNLADANERCDWRLYCDFAQALIRIARKLSEVRAIALRNASQLRVRWDNDPEFWGDLLVACRAGDEQAIEAIRRQGKLLFCGEIVPK